jgi:type I restriction enzyme M protein
MDNGNNVKNWLKERYYSLVDKFKQNDFNSEDAFNFLLHKHHDDKSQAKIILAELKKYGLLKSRKDKKDARQRIYTLVSLIPAAKKELTRGELESILKRAADIIRTRVDYTFILLLLFYKRISDKWKADYEKEIKKLLKEGFTEAEARQEAKEPAYHDLDLPAEYLWDEIRKDPLKLSANLSTALYELGNRNSSISDIFAQYNFEQFTKNTENSEILRQLIELFSIYSLETASADMLGDAYEWILRYFAPQKAKEGEVYTSREVIKLMTEILEPASKEKIYDPAMGSGGMLIVCYHYIQKKSGVKEAEKTFLFGQEANLKTLALARMNIIIHDIRGAKLEKGDTLLWPKFKQKDGVETFDKIISNPPWNQDTYDEETLKKGDFWQARFPFGFTTKQSADWAWVQHMYASLNSKGKLAVILDTGAVSRGSGKKSDREKAIRAAFVDRDLIECVILLPENLFYNTGAPGIIMVINKNKPARRKNRILLINASAEFEKGKPKNFLTEKNILAVAKCYQDFSEKEGFAKIISLADIQAADYNLSPSRFVAAIDNTTYRPIKEILTDIGRAETVEKKISRDLKKIFNKLQI